MAADRIERFVLAAKAIRAARIDDAVAARRPFFAAFDIGQQARRVYKNIARPKLESSRSAFRQLATQRQTGLFPGIDSAIKQGDAIVPHPAQQPPQAPGDHAASVVIDNHLRATRNTCRAQFCAKHCRVG